MSRIASLRRTTLLWVIVSSFAWSTPIANAVSSVSANSMRMAEYLYYSIPRSGLLADWLDSIKLSSTRRAELLELVSTLKQKKAKLPAIEWLPGASVIKVGSGARVYKVGFDKMLARRELTVNGASFFAKTDEDFTEMAKRLSQTAAPKEGSYDGLVAVLFYQFGLDEADACNSPTTAANCASKTDASILKNLIGNGGTIHSFQCEGRKFSAIGVSQDGAPKKERPTKGIAYEYDQKGRATKVSLITQDQTVCNFTLSEGHFVSVEDSNPGRGNCDARAANEWNSTFRPLKAGDVPKLFALVPIPIQRLQRCCADHICREEIAEAVVPSSTATTAALTIEP